MTLSETAPPIVVNESTTIPATVSSDLAAAPLPPLTSSPTPNTSLSNPSPAPVTTAVAVIATPTPGQITSEGSSTAATPTEAASIPTAGPTANPPTATAPPANTQSPPTPTGIPTTASGWAFARVKLLPDPGGSGSVVYGEAINNTGSPQRVLNITGEFFNTQGQRVAGPLDTIASLPSNLVATGERLPFEVLISRMDDQAATFTLEVNAQASSQSVQQTYEFFESSTTTLRGQFCVSSQVRRPQPAPAEYWQAVLVLLDSDGNMIGLSDAPYEPDLSDLVSGPSHSFQICVIAYNRAVSGYELRAWGR